MRDAFPPASSGDVMLEGSWSSSLKLMDDLCY
jgi:hypothetical protein